MLSLPLIQTGRYEEGIRQPISRLWASEPPQAILEDLAANRNALPDRIGRDKQRRAYVDKTCKPNA